MLVLGSMAQFMQPEDQTSFLALRCVHALSAQADFSEAWGGAEKRQGRED